MDMRSLKHNNYTALGFRIEDFLKHFTRAMRYGMDQDALDTSDQINQRSQEQSKNNTDMWTQCGPWCCCILQSFIKYL